MLELTYNFFNLFPPFHLQSLFTKQNNANPLAV